MMCALLQAESSSVPGAFALLSGPVSAVAEFQGVGRSTDGTDQKGGTRPKLAKYSGCCAEGGTQSNVHTGATKL